MSTAAFRLENGVIFHGEEQYATYDAAKDTVYRMERPAPTHYTAITSLLGHKPKYDIGEPNEIPGGKKVDPVTIPPQPPADNAHVKKGAEQFSEPEPKQDPAMGDKTPDFMRWLKKTDPVEFAKRYSGRVVPDID